VQVERAIHVTVFNLGVYCKSWAFEEIIEHYRSVSRPQLPTKKYINIRDKQDFYEQLSLAYNLLHHHDTLSFDIHQYSLWQLKNLTRATVYGLIHDELNFEDDFFVLKQYSRTLKVKLVMSGSLPLYVNTFAQGLMPFFGRYAFTQSFTDDYLWNEVVSVFTTPVGAYVLIPCQECLKLFQ